MQEKIEVLYTKDTSEAFQVLQELETHSDQSPDLYPYLDQFITMLDSDKYVIRVRGFRLICRQAQWDDDKHINQSIDQILAFLDDDKPTAVRQGLAALHHIVKYKPELHEAIAAKAESINPYRYKDTMHSLLTQDVDDLLAAIDQD